MGEQKASEVAVDNPELTNYLKHELEYWEWLFDKGHIKDLVRSIKSTAERVDGIGR